MRKSERERSYYRFALRSHRVTRGPAPNVRESAPPVREPVSWGRGGSCTYGVTAEEDLGHERSPVPPSHSLRCHLLTLLRYRARALFGPAAATPRHTCRMFSWPQSPKGRLLSRSSMPPGKLPPVTSRETRGMSRRLRHNQICW